MNETMTCPRCDLPGSHPDADDCIAALQGEVGRLRDRAELMWVLGHLNDAQQAYSMPLEVDRLREWASRKATAQELSLALSDQTARRGQEVLLDSAAPEIVDEDVLAYAAHHNLWQLLAERKLLPETFGYDHNLLSSWHFSFGADVSKRRVDRRAQDLHLLAEAGCDLPDGSRHELVQAFSSAADSDYRTVHQRRARCRYVEALAHFPELTSDDLDALWGSVRRIARYNADPKTSGQYVDPSRALEALLHHPQADSLLERIDTEAEDPDTLRAFSAVPALRHTSRLRARMIASDDPVVLERLCLDPDIGATDELWLRLRDLDPEASVRVLESDIDVASGLDPSALAPLLSTDDRDLRTRAIALVGTPKSAKRTR